MDTGESGPAEEIPLERTFKTHWVFAIALGSAVGWGAFILPADWLGTSGTLGAAVGIALGGALIAIIGLSYGSVIRRYPVTGGELAFAYKAIGRRSAFVTGWFLALGYTGIVALNATALALVFRLLFPRLMEHGRLWEVAGWPIYVPSIAVAIAAIVVFGILNARGTELSGRIQFWACMLMLGAVALMLVLVFVQYLKDPVPIVPAIPDGKNPFGSIAAIMAIAPWAYVGFNNVPQLAGEFDFSPSKARGLILWAVGCSAFIYVAMVLTTSLATAHGGLDSDSPWPTADIVSRAIGPIGTVLMALGVLMGVFTGLNGFFMSASRILMTMSRAGMIPSVLGRVSPRFGTPYVAIIAVAAVCCITPFFGRETLNWVVDMTSAGVTVAYLFTCVCAVRGISEDMRAVSTAQDSGHDRSGHAMLRLHLRRAVSVIGCVLAVVFLGLLFIPGSPGQLSGPALTLLLIWSVLGLIFFLVRRRSLMHMSDDELSEILLSKN